MCAAIFSDFKNLRAIIKFDVQDAVLNEFDIELSETGLKIYDFFLGFSTKSRLIEKLGYFSKRALYDK